MHPGISHENDTILNGLLYYYPPISHVPRAGIVHRLDKNTTGLMIVAKNLYSQVYLMHLMQEKQIKREYEALVSGVIHENGVINHPIKRHPVKRTQMMVHSEGKEAKTYYNVIKKYKLYTHLKIGLETGRTHQIRVHMAYINHPVLGDPTYGISKRRKKMMRMPKIVHTFKRQALHATTLRFIHPRLRTQVEFKIPLPEDIKNLISFLKK